MAYRVVDHQARIGENWGTRVITGLGKRDGYGGQYYQWRCDVCGALGQCKYSSLIKAARCPSCPRPHLRKRPFETLYHRVVHASNKRGISLEITYEEFLQFTTVANCHYCGARVKWVPHWTQDSQARAYNLDRIDNDKGYSVDNCVVACTRCNLGRNKHFSYHEWVMMTAALKMARECPLIGIAE